MSGWIAALVAEELPSEAAIPANPAMPSAASPPKTSVEASGATAKPVGADGVRFQYMAWDMHVYTRIYYAYMYCIYIYA